MIFILDPKKERKIFNFIKENLSEKDIQKFSLSDNFFKIITKQLSLNNNTDNKLLKSRVLLFKILLLIDLDNLNKADFDKRVNELKKENNELLEIIKKIKKYLTIDKKNKQNLEKDILIKKIKKEEEIFNILYNKLKNRVI